MAASQQSARRTSKSERLPSRSVSSRHPRISAAPRAFFLIFSVTHGDAVARCSAMPTVGLLPVAREGTPADVRLTTSLPGR
jgi:hypothetical protein